MFVDCQSFGTAYRWLVDLFNLIEIIERDHLMPLLEMVSLVCCGMDTLLTAISTLSTCWTQLKYHATTRKWAEEAWSVHLHGMSEKDSQSMCSSSPAPPVKEPDDIFYARPRCQAVTFPPPQQNGSASTQWSHHDTTTNMLAFGNIIVKVLQSQATQNLRWHQESQMVLLKNIQATGIAVAATGTTKEARLTDSKLRILHTCSRFEVDAVLLSPLQLYLEANREGGMTDTFSWVLR